MAIKGMFKGLSDASVGTRLPTPAIGTADYLVNSIKMHENREGGHRVNVNCTCLRVINGDQRVGDKVSHVMFSGNYFLTELKRLILCVAGNLIGDGVSVEDLMCPVEDEEGKPTPYAALSEDERSAAAWEKIAQDTCAIDADGNPTAAGDFDGQVVIRLETSVKPGKATGKYVKDEATGDLVPEIGKDFINTFPVARIPFEEVADFLDEGAIVKYFGSAEALMELVSND
jgi:hypothetical protein